MTDVKRLLEEATALPWVVQEPGDNDPGAGTVFIDTHAYSEGPEPVIAETYPLKVWDARLIVHAVNSLPAYEAAVEALAYYVNERNAYHDCANDAPNWRHRCRVAKAREALRRLREEAS